MHVHDIPFFLIPDTGTRKRTRINSPILTDRPNPFSSRIAHVQVSSISTLTSRDRKKERERDKKRIINKRVSRDKTKKEKRTKNISNTGNS
jgi:hypothetical protein